MPKKKTAPAAAAEPQRPTLSRDEQLRATAMSLAVQMAPLLRPRGEIKDRDLIADAEHIVKWLKGEGG